jgi:hypothetical protein
MAENCCTAPRASAKECGATYKDVRLGDVGGVGLSTDTAAVSDAPQLHAAITRKLPTNDPGEYTPVELMAPPVAVQLIVTGWVCPSDHVSVALN